MEFHYYSVMDCLNCQQPLRTGKKYCSPKCTNEALHWKGEDASLSAIHKWVVYHLGPADHCEFDSSHESTKFEWSNISQTYKRDLKDWRQLCPSCHRVYDDNASKGWTTRKQNTLDKNKLTRERNMQFCKNGHAIPEGRDKCLGKGCKYS